MRGEGDAEGGEAACPDADDEALAEEELPQILAEGLQNESDEDEQRADDEQVARVAEVEDGPDDEAQKDHQEVLQRANGRDLERGVVAQDIRRVVRLKGAEAGYQTWEVVLARAHPL